MASMAFLIGVDRRKISIEFVGFGIKHVLLITSCRCDFTGTSLFAISVTEFAPRRTSANYSSLITRQYILLIKSLLIQTLQQHTRRLFQHRKWIYYFGWRKRWLAFLVFRKPTARLFVKESKSARALSSREVAKRLNRWRRSSAPI